jgi:hypothetical protein
MNWLLIDMTNYHVVGRFATEDEADAGKEAHVGPSNVRALEGAWEGFNGVDLAKLFNALPGAKPVQRFATREKGRQRCIAALQAIDGIPTYVAPPATVVPASTITTQEPAPMAKRKTAKPNGAPDPTLNLTTAGKKDKLRFNSGSARSKVFDAIKRADGSIALSEVVKRCAHFAKRGQVMGCVEKLKLKGYVS